MFVIQGKEMFIEGNQIIKDISNNLYAYRVDYITDMLNKIIELFDIVKSYFKSSFLYI